MSEEDSDDPRRSQRAARVPPSAILRIFRAAHPDCATFHPAYSSLSSARLSAFCARRARHVASNRNGAEFVRASVARMERSAIRDRAIRWPKPIRIFRAAHPDFSALHPGYGSVSAKRADRGGGGR